MSTTTNAADCTCPACAKYDAACEAYVRATPGSSHWDTAVALRELFYVENRAPRCEARASVRA